MKKSLDDVVLELGPSRFPDILEGKPGINPHDFPGLCLVPGPVNFVWLSA
jgi:hypothetical protein